MPWWIASLNTLAALASTGFGIAALVEPGLLARASGVDVSSRFHPAMYAGRAVPLGMAVGIVVWLAPVSAASSILLGVAALAQVADLVIGAVHGLPGMIAGAGFAAACHVAAIVATSGG